jgi:hypothetical protein
MNFSPPSFSSRFQNWCWMFLFLAAVAPGILSFAPVSLHWDEAYYADRVICMSREFSRVSPRGMAGCLTGHKGVAIELVGLLWGRAGATESGIGLALVGLGFLNFLFALVTYGVAIRAGLAPWSLALAALSIGLTRDVQANAGTFMTDTLVAWCTALTLMLIVLEARVPDQRPWASFLRGALWAVALATGSLAKLTFGFFAAAVLPIIIYLRWRNCGRRPLLFTLAGALVFSLPALAILGVDGPAMVRFALFASFGEAAALWRVPGLTFLGYVARFFANFHFALIPLGLLALLFVRGVVKEKVRLLPLGVVFVYLGVAAMGQNRESRYLLPLAIALPLVLSWNSSRYSPPLRFEAVHFLGGALLALMVAVPMVARPILGPIRQAKDLEENLSLGKPTVIELATDGLDYNINTFLLARQIGYATLQPVQLDTLVYDAIAKRTLEDGYRRISSADYVLFLKPEFDAGPTWSRQWESQYRSYVATRGTPVSQISSPFEVFRLTKP